MFNALPFLSSVLPCSLLPAPLLHSLLFSLLMNFFPTLVRPVGELISIRVKDPPPCRLRFPPCVQGKTPSDTAAWQHSVGSCINHVFYFLYADVLTSEGLLTLEGLIPLHPRPGQFLKTVKSSSRSMSFLSKLTNPDPTS